MLISLFHHSLLYATIFLPIQREKPAMNMTMEMGHGSPTNATESIHGHAMAMPAIFTTGIHITLFLKDWRTASILSYILTLLFLFSLAWFNRFLGILKIQIATKAQPIYHAPGAPILKSAVPRRRPNPITKEHMSPLPLYMEIDREDGENSSPISSTPFLRSHVRREDGIFDSNRDDRSQTLTARAFHRHCSPWAPSRIWSWKHDGLCSFLEGIRALIGYLL